MPIYEYKCRVCADRFDIEQSITDDTLTSLAGCEVADDGDHQLKKVFSAVGISFKGDGFYRNDSRSSSSGSSDSDSSSSTSSNGASDASSSSGGAEAGSGSSSGDSGSGSKGSKGSKESKAPAGSSSSAD